MYKTRIKSTPLSYQQAFNLLIHTLSTIRIKTIKRLAKLGIKKTPKRNA